MHPMSIDEIKTKIAFYGFIEISYIFSFLDLVCRTPPTESDYIYIRSSIGSCLKKHDDGSDYFIPLRDFALELDYLV